MSLWSCQYFEHWLNSVMTKFSHSNVSYFWTRLFLHLSPVSLCAVCVTAGLSEVCSDWLYRSVSLHKCTWLDETQQLEELVDGREELSVRMTVLWMSCCFHLQWSQDYTFRDHFYSFWLEKCVSKVFGLANHDDESWYSLLSVKRIENNDSFHTFSVIDDRSLLPCGVLRKGIWSEWLLFVS